MPSRVRVRLGQWNKLNKPWEHRVSMMKTMVTQLLEKERIRTTLAKAKTLQRFADQVITMGKAGTREAWVKASGVVRTDRELHKLFTTLALRYHQRPGGYTRLLRAGWRERDAAPVAFVELVDRVGELRPAKPAVPPIGPFTVQRWVRQQLGQPIPQPGPLLPPAVQVCPVRERAIRSHKAYLKEENRLQQAVPLALLPGQTQQQKQQQRPGLLGKILAAKLRK